MKKIAASFGIGQRGRHATFVFAASLLLAVSSARAAADDIVYQTPLAVGSSVPGNLLLVPSVEFPTIDSVANIASTYSVSSDYVGYFDADKCYKYSYSDTETERHFYPSSIPSTTHTCTGNDEWSGNFLNWIGTQTIDPFRSALTGGYRVRDTTSETWLEKARSDGNSSSTYFPDRTLAASAVAGATPFQTTSGITFTSKTLGNKLYFTLPTGWGYDGTDTSTSTVFNDSGTSSTSWTNSSSSFTVTNSSTQYKSANRSLKASSTSGTTTNTSSKDLDSAINGRNFVFSGWVYSTTTGNDLLTVAGSSGGYGVKFTSSAVQIVRMTGTNATSLVSASWTKPSGAWFKFTLEAKNDYTFALTVVDASGNTLASAATTSPDTSYTGFTKVVLYPEGNKTTYYADDLIVSVTTTNIPFASTGTANQYEASVRVKVCDAGVGLEDNCVEYPSGYYKPEGLIQKYADRVRYGIFGYLNDSYIYRDGGILRANMKFVGQTEIETDGSKVDNTYAEWNPNTGVLYQNPNPADATATTTVIGDSSYSITNSGVINYLNKFGEMTTENHKSYDPVSELYYAAIRYLKNKGDVSEYSSLAKKGGTTATAAQKYIMSDGFPVITTWNDPIQYYCQKNAILGIGDVYTHRDKNLYGNSVTSEEPATPSAVSADTSVNVVTATQKIASLEGITINTPFTGRNNSAYIAGLAYDSHTKDMRSDLDGDQTVSTYWVDVREGQTLVNKSSNQYWLAAKYGGFDVPDGFAPYSSSTTSLNQDWWSSGETLSTGDLRPTNFYVASDAAKMVESLTEAFASIVGKITGSGTGVSTNSTSLEEGSTVYQAQYSSNKWDGDLLAYLIDPTTGEVANEPSWSAADEMPAWDSRTIYVNKPGTGLVNFLWTNLTAAQKTALVSEDVVKYLRGDRSKESPDGSFRARDSILGDIVNSQAVYVGSAPAKLYSTSTFTGASKYDAYVTATNSRMPVLYVGANDGMMHAFRADTGVELFAFVPNTVALNGMKTLSDPDYTHTYFVDGEITVADVYEGNASSGAWKSILVGTLGRGGPGIFAFDVTDPSAPQFLWEKNGDDIPALGRNLGKPVIAQIADGDWRVILGNGPDSEDGDAQLIMIAIDDGSTTVVDADAGSANGLSAVYTWDGNDDGFTDTLYAGDLEGHLWRFTNLTASTPAAATLFSATDTSTTPKPQPITAAPLVGQDPDTDKLWVFFGTGRYLNKNDIADTQVQTWYGLIDDSGTAISGRSALVEREILAEAAVGDLAVRVITQADGTEISEAKKGWYIDLVSPGTDGAKGERMVVPNTFKGATLIGTTRIPDTDDSCQTGGTGWVMAIDPFTGTALPSSFYDISGDGKVNGSDTVTINGTTYVVSGIGFDSGPNSPTFISSVMEVGLDNTDIKTIMTSSSSSESERTSWREVIEE